MSLNEPSTAIDDEQRRRIGEAMTQADLALPQVWLHYFSITGTVDEYEIDAYLNRMIALPPTECDKLAHAVNELIDDIPPRPRAPFRDEISP
ncbi:hypothetical protein C4K88_16595 [Arthrobacter pityocampae]|uniref:Uncharacterized protein n=1 Tax=Arthrobacter pityocampae TaxID=547334 RepID=A0A2S5IU40_9MICC|nr:hypothetical protein [Arthrobacter pityocampae]PPB48065.1 hypothetical protein C4K88_16595 [Arthrobacter pityocampae]